MNRGGASHFFAGLRIEWFGLEHPLRYTTGGRGIPIQLSIAARASAPHAQRKHRIVPVSAEERHADREPPEFWPLPDVLGPHLAAWNGESWDVVALPDGDCGVHEGNGPHCFKCAATALWAKQQPTPREARGASKPSHPWRKGLPTVERRVESFRRRAG